MSEQIVSVNQEAIKSELRKLVKTTVEQTINELIRKLNRTLCLFYRTEPDTYG